MFSLTRYLRLAIILASVGDAQLATICFDVMHRPTVLDRVRHDLSPCGLASRQPIEVPRKLEALLGRIVDVGHL